jgi:hypothetical protein
MIGINEEYLLLLARDHPQPASGFIPLALKTLGILKKIKKSDIIHPKVEGFQK